MCLSIWKLFSPGASSQRSNIPNNAAFFRFFLQNALSSQTHSHFFRCRWKKEIEKCRIHWRLMKNERKQTPPATWIETYSYISRKRLMWQWFMLTVQSEFEIVVFFTFLTRRVCSVGQAFVVGRFVVFFHSWLFVTYIVDGYRVFGFGYKHVKYNPCQGNYINRMLTTTVAWGCKWWLTLFENVFVLCVNLHTIRPVFALSLCSFWALLTGFYADGMSMNVEKC